ncbi:MAG: SpoIVB peptidase [Bacilli bacterium]|nr:SpoIVB peptidase [Bacilli bacterium]
MILLLVFTIDNNITIKASSLEVIPGGETIGIKLNTGVYVAGKYSVETINGKKNPWQKADIEIGDKILEIDKKKINNNDELIKQIESSKDYELVLTIGRGSIEFDTNIELVENKQGERSIGLYLKDKLLGVGTLTFIDPETKNFGALGHGIIDQKVLIGGISGSLLVSNVDSIKKASPGVPGEKRATLSNSVIGNLESNYATGLFGNISSRSLLNKDKIEVGTQDDIKIGPATIRTVLNGKEVKEYDIEIIEVNKQNTRNVKGIKIKVTDDELIEACGGIVQGMSGSPIIQNNKLVGAVSHVTIDDPLIGYGIHIEWMLEDCK